MVLNYNSRADNSSTSVAAPPRMRVTKSLSESNSFGQNPRKYAQLIAGETTAKKGKEVYLKITNLLETEASRYRKVSIPKKIVSEVLDAVEELVPQIPDLHAKMNAALSAANITEALRGLSETEGFSAAFVDDLTKVNFKTNFLLDIVI